MQTESSTPSAEIVDVKLVPKRGRPPKPQALAVVPPTTPLEMLAIAVQRGVGLEELKQLREMQKEWEADQARKAFVVAMADFKADPPKLEKTKTVDFTSQKGRTHYNYAGLDHVATVLGAALSKHGLSFRWNVQQKDCRVIVTCILQHAAGHSESVTMDGPTDETGNKNAIQQVGSTVTYLERYTLLASTGMATQEQDSDGATIKMSELTKHLECIEGAANQADLADMYRTALKIAVDAADPIAIKAITASKDKRKAQLQGGAA